MTSRPPRHPRTYQTRAAKKQKAARAKAVEAFITAKPPINMPAAYDTVNTTRGLFMKPSR